MGRASDSMMALTLVMELEIRRFDSHNLSARKKFDCIGDKKYPSTTFLGKLYSQIVVAIFQEQAFCTLTLFSNCLRNMHRYKEGERPFLMGKTVQVGNDQE